MRLKINWLFDFFAQPVYLFGNEVRGIWTVSSVGYRFSE